MIPLAAGYGKKLTEQKTYFVYSDEGLVGEYDETGLRS